MKAIAGVMAATMRQLRIEMDELTNEELIKALDDIAWLKAEILTTIRDRGLTEGI